MYFLVDGDDIRANSTFTCERIELKELLRTARKLLFLYLLCRNFQSFLPKKKKNVEIFKAQKSSTLLFLSRLHALEMGNPQS